MSKRKKNTPSAEGLSIAYAVLAEFPESAQKDLSGLVEIIARNHDNNAGAWDDLLKLHAQQVQQFAAERGITLPFEVVFADAHELGKLDEYIPAEHAENWNALKINVFRHQAAWSGEHCVTAHLGGSNPCEWELHFPHDHVVKITLDKYGSVENVVPIPSSERSPGFTSWITPRAQYDELVAARRLTLPHIHKGGRPKGRRLTAKQREYQRIAHEFKKSSLSERAYCRGFGIERGKLRRALTYFRRAGAVQKTTS